MLHIITRTIFSNPGVEMSLCSPYALAARQKYCHILNMNLAFGKCKFHMERSFRPRGEWGVKIGLFLLSGEGVLSRGSQIPAGRHLQLTYLIMRLYNNLKMFKKLDIFSCFSFNVLWKLSLCYLYSYRNACRLSKLPYSGLNLTNMQLATEKKVRSCRCTLLPIKVGIEIELIVALYWQWISRYTGRFSNILYHVYCKYTLVLPPTDHWVLTWFHLRIFPYNESLWSHL